MLLYNDIVKDDKKVLREKCVDLTFPLTDIDKENIRNMHEYLNKGYDEEYVKTHDIRPGVGLAYPQIGVSKKLICITSYDEKGDFYDYVIANPKIISNSVELIYLESGEGCLSVEKNYKGFIHRYKRVKVKCTLIDPETFETQETTLSFKGYLSIIFQHEYDHLNGILFYDHINKENPFNVKENSKPLIFD